MNKLLKVLLLLPLFTLVACGGGAGGDGGPSGPSKKIGSNWTLVDTNYSSTIPSLSINLTGVQTDNSMYDFRFSNGCRMAVALNGSDFTGLFFFEVISGCADPVGTEVRGAYNIAANNELSLAATFVNNQSVYTLSSGNFDSLIEIYR